METIRELQTSVEPGKSGVGPPPPQASHDHNVDIGTGETVTTYTPACLALTEDKHETVNITHLTNCSLFP